MRATLSLLVSLGLSQSAFAAYSWNDEELVVEIEPVEVQYTATKKVDEKTHQLRMAKIERMEEIAFEERDHELLEKCAKMREMQMQLYEESSE